MAERVHIVSIMEFEPDNMNEAVTQRGWVVTEEVADQIAAGLGEPYISAMHDREDVQKAGEGVFDKSIVM